MFPTTSLKLHLSLVLLNLVGIFTVRHCARLRVSPSHGGQEYNSGATDDRLNDLLLRRSIYVSSGSLSEPANQPPSERPSTLSSYESEPQSFEATPESLAQFTQFDDQIGSQPQRFPHVGPASTYGVGDNHRPNNSYSSLNIHPFHLTRDFLNLFDELWRIKNQSVIALVRLDYFTPNRTNGLSIEPVLPDDTSENKNANCVGARCRISGPLANLVVPLPSTTPSSRPNSSPDWPIMQTPGGFSGHIAISGSRKPNTDRGGTSIIKSGWNEFASRLAAWVSQTQERASVLVMRLVGSFVGKFSVNRAGPQQQTSAHNLSELDDRPSESTGGAEPRLEDERDRKNADVLTVRVRRQTPYESGDPTGATPRRACVEPDQITVAQCRKAEATINNSLNNSFPGTLTSIEENCRHVSFLLGNCWPQQLNQLRVSLAGWNESLLQSTDFPLPGTSPIQVQDPRLAPVAWDGLKQSMGSSCGVTPLSPSVVLDRVNWMWLNLCMDQKFRQDYVDNLSCLSMWNQEKAQVVCHHEYRRMQSQIDSADPNSSEYTQNHFNNNKADPRGESSATENDQQNSSSNGTSTHSATGGQLGPRIQEEIDRELGSKALCCVFDLFLRCVHKQANRDCSRAGAQFVVNFMSRIGTDDMKFLCNNEPRLSRATQQQPAPQLLGTPSVLPQRYGKAQGSGGGSRRASLMEKSPFIEGNYYCLDSRILNILGSRFGTNHMSPSSRPSSNKNRVRNQVSVNHDPSYFGSESLVPDSGNGVVRSRSTAQAVLLMGSQVLLLLLVLL